MLRLSICIDVPNLNSATRFYCDALGCVLTEQKATHNTVTVAGTTIHLSLKDPGSSATGTGTCPRTYERHWTPVHLDFYVKDIDSVTGAIERLGGTVENSKKGDWGAAAFCADPFGNGFCLIVVHGESPG